MYIQFLQLLQNNLTWIFLLFPYKQYLMRLFQLPYWKDTVLGFHEMTKDEIALFPQNVT